MYINLIVMNQLSLSLQFARFPDVGMHRAALPRHRVAKWMRHALQDDAEITVRIVDTDEAQALNRDYRQKDYANLLIHGTLHAQGWDHDEDEDAQVMELRESEIMARLGFDDPYAEAG